MNTCSVNDIYEQILPGNTYHFYNRGNNKDNIFLEEKNYSHFLRLWNKHITPIATTFAYSLLKNHFHTLARINEEEEIEAAAFKKSLKFKDRPVDFISQGFKNLFNAYAKSINKGYGRTGSLFRERFRRKRIETDSYFTEVIFYIHGNSQHHGFTKDFRTYPHSSYLSLLSDKPTSLQREHVLEWFGGKDQFIRYHQEYREVLIEKTKFLEHPDDDMD